MPTPTIILEFLEGSFEALYSDTELRFIIVNRTEYPAYTEISGPYAPTLEKYDLSSVVEGVRIPNRLFTSPDKGPYLGPPDPDDLDIYPEPEPEPEPNKK